jgi:hypothetical protein
MDLLKDAVRWPIFWSPLYLILPLMKLAHLGAVGYTLIKVYWWPPKVAAAIVNRTIDDQLGDSVTGLQPTYFPTNAWDKQNVTCNGTGCPIIPDTIHVFHKTYTEGTYYPALGSIGITMQFNGRHYNICSLYPDRRLTGTAIYVFFLLTDYQAREEGPVELSSANFTVDDKAPIPFTYKSGPSESASLFEYETLVFSNTNLPSTLHTLNITTTGSASAYVLFDYAIYT